MHIDCPSTKWFMAGLWRSDADRTTSAAGQLGQRVHDASCCEAQEVSAILSKMQRQVHSMTVEVRVRLVATSSPPKAAQRRRSDSSRSTARTPQSRMPPGTAAASPARPACSGRWMVFRVH